MVLTMGEPSKLKQLRQLKGWTQEELAKEVGVQRLQVIQWERGRQDPSFENLLRLSQVFGVTMGELKSEGAMLKSNVRPSPSVDADVMVPVCGRVTAGPFRFVERSEAIRWVAGDRGDKGSFALIVEGDSMEPTYRNGDEIFCRPAAVRFEIDPDAEDEKRGHVPFEKVRHLQGKDCVVLLNGEVTFKRITIEKNGGIDYKVILTPLNESYPAVTVRHGDECVVQGIVYKWTRHVE